MTGRFCRCAWQATLRQSSQGIRRRSEAAFGRPDEGRRDEKRGDCHGRGEDHLRACRSRGVRRRWLSGGRRLGCGQRRRVGHDPVRLRGLPQHLSHVHRRGGQPGARRARRAEKPQDARRAVLQRARHRADRARSAARAVSAQAGRRASFGTLRTHHLGRRAFRARRAHQGGRRGQGAVVRLVHPRPGVRLGLLLRHDPAPGALRWHRGGHGRVGMLRAARHHRGHDLRRHAVVLRLRQRRFDDLLGQAARVLHGAGAAHHLRRPGARGQARRHRSAALPPGGERG